MFQISIGGRIKAFKEVDPAVEYAFERLRTCYKTLDELISEIWTWEKAKRDYNQLLRVNGKALIGNKTIKQVTTGVLFPNYFMTHRYSVKIGKISSAEKYLDDDLLKKALKRGMTKLKANKVNEGVVLRVIYLTHGTQSAGNFMPAVAKGIYETFCPDGGKIFDPSCGFGGRITGCLSAQKNFQYFGTDPARETFEGLSRLIESLGAENRAFIQCCPFEDVDDDFIAESDLIFTSPPYFSKEKYSDEETQSWKRYPEYKDWRDGFLALSIEKAYRGLKRNRYFIWNVNDVNIGKDKFPLVKDSIEISQKVGFKYLEMKKMLMAKIPGHYKIKYEPVLIFKKG